MRKRHADALLARRSNARKMSAVNRRAVAVGGYASPNQGPELKYLDDTLALLQAGVATFQSPLCINSMPAGATAVTRIGQKIHMKSILLRYTLTLEGAGGSPCRIMVVYDKQTNAVAPGVADILLANDFNSPNNLTNRDRFVTIFDHITEPVSDQNNWSVSGTLFKTFDLETIFNVGTGTGVVADIKSGSLLVMAAQNGEIITTAPVLAFRTRIRFTDA